MFGYGWSQDVVGQDILMLLEDRDDAFIHSAEHFIHAAEKIGSDNGREPHTLRTEHHDIGQWATQLVQQVVPVDRAGLAVLGKALMPLALSGVKSARKQDEATWWASMQRQIEYIDHPAYSQRIAGQEYDRQKLCLALPLAPGDHSGLVLAVEKKAGKTITEPERLILHALAQLFVPLFMHYVPTPARPEWEVLISQTCHELLTPLTASKMSVQIAERKLQSVLKVSESHSVDYTVLEDIQHLLSVADRQIRIEDRLVHDLNDLAHEHDHGMSIKPQQCDLVEVITQAVESQRLGWPNRVITLEAPSACIVESDPDRLSQVATNYLTNALKYAPAEYPIHVRLAPHRRTVRLEVIDHGPGLTSEEKRQIWKNNYRSLTTARRVPGWGLGLAICRAIMHSLKGKTGVRSVSGEGATFWFSLPIESETTVMKP